MESAVVLGAWHKYNTVREDFSELLGIKGESLFLFWDKTPIEFCGTKISASMKNLVWDYHKNVPLCEYPP